MSRVSPLRRISAAVAFAGPIVLVGLTLVVLRSHAWLLAVSFVGLALAAVACLAAIARAGIRRMGAAGVALVALIVPVLYLLRYGGWFVVVAGLLIGLSLLSARYALSRDVEALKLVRTPGIDVVEASRPVLFVNTRSGGGKVEEFGLVDAARQRGIHTVILEEGQDLEALARRAVDDGADVIGMAGGDGSQALVAGVAMACHVGFVCVPAGTRNHLALDLGLDRDDIVGALDAFGPAVERRVDVGTVGDRIFLNNATVGLYAEIVQSSEYRANKISTALSLLPHLLDPDAVPFDLGFAGPDGAPRSSAHLIMVSNNPYELGRAEGFGSRPSMSTGVLGIVVADFPAAGKGAHGVQEWTASEFEITSSGPIAVGLDGEALELDSPLRFGILPGALRVRLPLNAPGFSPAAASPARTSSTLGALVAVLMNRSTLTQMSPMTAPTADPTSRPTVRR